MPLPDMHGTFIIFCRLRSGSDALTRSVRLIGITGVALIDTRRSIRVSDVSRRAAARHGAPGTKLLVGL